MLGNTGPARHSRAGFLEGEAIETPPPIGRESQDPTVTFGGLGLVPAQDDKPKCQVFGQR